MPKLLTLRPLLIIDAATCAAMGLALSIGAAALSALTGLPAALLFYAGLSLLPIAVFMALVARRPHPGTVRLAVLGNAAWVAASLLLLASGPLFSWVAPNALGIALVSVQAIGVAALSLLEQTAARAAQPQAA